MILPSALDGARVLVTGGTSGIGLATGLAFARCGARVVLTHSWGSHDCDALVAGFTDRGWRAPLVVQADVANPDDATALMDAVEAHMGGVDVFVSNVAVAQMVSQERDLNLRALNRSIAYSTWPVVDYTYRIKERFGVYPRHVVAVSSSGAHTWHMKYDLAGACKGALEVLVAYLAERVAGEGCHVNGVRPLRVDTPSGIDVGGGFREWAHTLSRPHTYQSTGSTAGCIVALCSGWMNGVRGQILTVDQGVGFYDGVMGLYAEQLADRTTQQLAEQPKKED